MHNALSTQTSPYLLQHASNPVHWQVWSEQTFELAVKLNKPILLSIGYSTCHWCHVMEHESFCDEQTANLMNELFVCIKLDREERPDIDEIYMTALQAMTGSGGWPLNIFLTPNKLPFYGGTYFPPKPFYNRASWREVIINVSNFYHKNKTELQTQTQNLITHLINTNTFSVASLEHNITQEECNKLCSKILESADEINGGFYTAPKFFQIHALNFLLQAHSLYNAPKALQHVVLTLKKIMQGGINDHLAGGFARYSTDAIWHVPHFEKMLYDNVQLLELYSKAFAETKIKEFKTCALEILLFLDTYLYNNAKGYFTAIDADSQGVEGKYYVWTKVEIEKLLTKNESELFCEYFNVSEHGNWEENNILFTKETRNEFAERKNLDIVFLEKTISTCIQKLLDERKKRIPPITDTKIILGQNCLAISCLINAGINLQEKHIILEAEAKLTFLLNLFSINNKAQNLKHSFAIKEPEHNAQLADYAYLIKALIDTAGATGHTHYLQTAIEYIGYVNANFFCEQKKLFTNTNKLFLDTPYNKIDVHDNVLPSANSIMYNNLLQISYLTNNFNMLHQANEMWSCISTQALQYPMHFANWCKINALQNTSQPELVIFSEEPTIDLLQAMTIAKKYKIIFCANNSQNPETVRLLQKDYLPNKKTFYLCYNKTCKTPLHNWEQTKNAIESIK